MPLDAGGQNLRRLFVHSSTRLQSCVTPRGHRSGPRRLQLHRAGPRMPASALWSCRRSAGLTCTGVDAQSYHAPMAW